MNSHSIFHPEHRRRASTKPGLIVLFGSGEMSPTGRKIHEDVFQLAGFRAPVRIGILETPTGYEVNAVHGWPERMQTFLEGGLKNYTPQVTRIRGWRRDGAFSTNNADIVDAILDQDYIYCGAGSPGYTVKHLKDTRAYKNLVEAHKNGAVLSLGSATAVATGTYAIPVYEIFKAGEDLHWLEALNLFNLYDLSLSIVPHWNNQEGEDFDTTRCWMGKERFATLLSMLPREATVLGIDEQTACILDCRARTIFVKGIGEAHILKGTKDESFGHGETFSFEELT